MTKQQIQEALNWDIPKTDFEPDGSLRDIYVYGTTIDDWRKVLQLILREAFEAQLLCDGIRQPIPTDIESLFGTTSNLLRLSVGGVELACHVFAVDEIEFDFVPNSLTEDSLLQLLEFMVAVGTATSREVSMTPENCPEVQIFRYEPNGDELRWVRPELRSR